MVLLRVDSSVINLSDTELVVVKTAVKCAQATDARGNTYFEITGNDLLKVVESLSKDQTAMVLETQKLTAELDLLRAWKKYYVLRGVPRDLAILKFLSDEERPCTLNSICKFLWTDPEYQKIYKSKLKPSIQNSLSKLALQLREATRARDV